MPRQSLFVEVGQRIGRGVVIETGLTLPRPGRAGLRAARLLCDCGNEYVSALQALVGKRQENQRTMSCGCRRREHQIASVTTHGMNNHPLAKTWDSMLRRCEDPGAPGYKNYGGRGIKVCDRWHDVRLFIADIETMLGPRPPGMSIDRYPDNDGNYEPGNVRWATNSQQMQNRRPYKRPDMAVNWTGREFRTEDCDYCGHEYQTRALAGNTRFCSAKCLAAERRASGKDDIERSCHQCGGAFTCNRYDATRHCSKSCAAKCQHAGGCPR
jgi:hypothetical protein